MGASESLVVVGTRRGENTLRDRVMAKAGDNSATGPLFQKQMDGGHHTQLYLPIANFSLEDVWECLAELTIPSAIDVNKGETLPDGTDNAQ